MTPIKNHTAIKGRIISLETRAKLSASLKGRKLAPYSKERCAAISKGKKGKPMTDAQKLACDAMIEARRGKTSWNKGKKLPPLSAEHRAKIGASGKGKPQSDAKRAAISKARKGMSFSESHKRALSEATKRNWDAGKLTAYRSKLEIRAGVLLEPLGFKAQFRFEWASHPFDYGHSETRVLVEVNGCYWHSHGCCAKDVGSDVIKKDAEIARLASEAGYQLIVLWQCLEAEWPVILKSAGVF